MKTISFFTAAMWCLCALSVQAQNETTAPERKIRLSLIKEENGEKKVIEKEFATEAELERYMKEQGEEMPALPQPPQPPSPPTAPEAPIQKKVVRVTKDADDKVITEDVSIQFIGKDDLPEIKELEKEMGQKTEGTEKIIIIRREKVVKDEPTGTGPENTVVWKEKEKQPANISQLSFYPNPNKGEFRLTFKVDKPADVNLRLLDVDGKEVYSDHVPGFSGLYEKDVRRGELSNGTYLMEVTTGTEKQTLKVIVQK